MKAKVYQYGNRNESQREVSLPAYVKAEGSILANDGGIERTHYCHQLADGECFGIGSAESWTIVNGNAPEEAPKA